MKYIIKSPAPALEKGIQALTRLSENGPRNLEKLSKDLGEPKASVLRYLETLQSLGLVGRDAVSKEYTSKVAMIRMDDSSRNLSEKVQKLLDSLAEKTCRTAEWYVQNGDRMVLAQRSEPENAVIHVKAKIGFERELDGEFESVARIAILNLNIDLSGKKYWIYRDGHRKNISESLCRKILESDKKNGYALDMEYNVNGIRRYAAPVFQNGKIAGVIALAENFRPDADSRILRISKILKDEINNINS